MTEIKNQPTWAKVIAGVVLGLLGAILGLSLLDLIVFLARSL